MRCPLIGVMNISVYYVIISYIQLTPLLKWITPWCIINLPYLSYETSCSARFVVFLFVYVVPPSRIFKVPDEVPHLIKLEVTVSILRNLRARNGILRLVSLLEVSPLLQRLKLNMLPQVLVGFSDQPEACWHFRPCAIYHLEQFEVSGFIGFRGQLEVLLCILDNTVAWSEPDAHRTEGDGVWSCLWTLAGVRTWYQKRQVMCPGLRFAWRLPRRADWALLKGPWGLFGFRCWMPEGYGNGSYK